MRGRVLIAFSLLAMLSGDCQVFADNLSDIQKLQSEYVAALNAGQFEKALTLSDDAIKIGPTMAGLWSDHGAILSEFLPEVVF
jgi:Flp pilus assembly protein TadD